MKAFAELAARIAEIERRMASTMRHGTVSAVDAANGLIRLKLGDGPDGDFLSPWIKYAQVGGALKVHSPPSVGQQFSLMSPSGDMSQGIAMPMGFSDASPSPSGAGDEHVLTFGPTTITLSGSSVLIDVGGISLEITSGGVAINGGMVTHNGKNIGSNHTHGGVFAGPASTDVPN